MVIRMNLFTVLLNIQEYSETDVLYVEQPWSLESDVILLDGSKEDTKPIVKNHQVFEYFLEIFMINELFEDLGTQNLCIQDQCQRIIEYVINDA